MNGHIGRIGFVALALVLAGAALLGEPEGASAGSVALSPSAPAQQPSHSMPATIGAPGFASAGLLAELPGFVMVSMSDDQLAAWHGAQVGSR